MRVWGGFNMLQARDVLFECIYKSKVCASVKSLQAADGAMELVPFTEIRLHSFNFNARLVSKTPNGKLS